MVKKQSKYQTIIDIVVAFVAAWLFYQLLSLVTGTPMPIVSVVSWSMYHNAPFDAWWQEKGSFYMSYGISKQGFQSFPAPNGLSRGDLLFVIKEDNVNVGDVVIFNTPSQPFTIVHRVIRINPDGTLETKGDANSGQNFYEHNIPRQQIIGKVILAVPLLGYPRLALYAVGI